MVDDDWRRAANGAMVRYTRGDDAAFAELYELIAPRLCSYLLQRTRDRAHTEDLLQQTFLRMHRARGHFCAGAAVMPWAIAIARRLLVDRFRQGKREPLMRESDQVDASQLLATDAPPDQMVELRRLTRRVEFELAEMPESYRVAFELVQLDGLSIAEAADVLGTTVTAMKMRAHRAYEALRKRLGAAALEGL